MTSNHPPPRIESPFFGPTPAPAAGWNQRLLDPRTKGTLGSHEAIRQAAQAFEKALANGEIRLVRVHRCPCGSQDLEPLSAYDRFALEFQSLICRTCGLIHLSHQVSQDNLQEYYDTYYYPLHYGEMPYGSLQRGQGTKIFEILSPFLIDRSRLSVAEVGAGTGRALFEFKAAARANGIETDELGVEFTELCVRHARGLGVEVVHGRLDRLVETGRKFDVVIMACILDRLSDLGGELEKLRRIVRDDTLVYVEVPGLMTLHENRARRFDYLRHVTHARPYSFNLTSLASTLSRSGFSLLAGNEGAQAVFRLGDAAVPVAGNYERLVNYLAIQEAVRPQLERSLAFEEELEERRAEAQRLSARLKRKQEELRQINDDWARADDRVMTAEQRANEAEEQVESLRTSTSWRVTFPLRQLAETTKRLVRGRRPKTNTST